jgi:hypothetical protein
MSLKEWKTKVPNKTEIETDVLDLALSSELSLLEEFSNDLIERLDVDAKRARSDLEKVRSRRAARRVNHAIGLTLAAICLIYLSMRGVINADFSIAELALSPEFLASYLGLVGVFIAFVMSRSNDASDISDAKEKLSEAEEKLVEVRSRVAKAFEKDMEESIGSGRNFKYTDRSSALLSIIRQINGLVT